VQAAIMLAACTLISYGCLSLITSGFYLSQGRHRTVKFNDTSSFVQAMTHVGKQLNCLGRATTKWYQMIT
jgi:hypothetical protein